MTILGPALIRSAERFFWSMTLSLLLISGAAWGHGGLFRGGGGTGTLRELVFGLRRRRRRREQAVGGGRQLAGVFKAVVVLEEGQGRDMV